MRGRFRRSGEVDRTLSVADAQHPQPVARSELAGGVVVGRDDDVGGHEHVRLGERRRRAECLPIRLDRFEHRGRAHVVVRTERKPQLARELRAVATAAAEDPHLDLRALTGDRADVVARRRSSSRPATARGSRRSALRTAGSRRRAAGAALAAHRSAASRTTLRATASSGSRARAAWCTRAGARRRRAGGGRRKPERPSPRSMRPGWSASTMPNCSTTDNGVWWPSCTAPDPTRMCCVAPATRLTTSAGAVAGDAGVQMVLGDPVPRVPGGFGALGEVERVAQRGRRGRAGRDRDEVEYRERERRPSHGSESIDDIPDRHYQETSNRRGDPRFENAARAVSRPRSTTFPPSHGATSSTDFRSRAGKPLDSNARQGHAREG